MESSFFDFNLPESQIAQAPREPRDHSKFLVCHQTSDGFHFEHSHFYDLPRFLNKNDWLVTNDAKVLPVRLVGVRLRDDGSKGGFVEVLLTKALSLTESAALALLSAKIKPGLQFLFEPGLVATVLSDDDERQKNNGEIRLRFSGPGLEAQSLQQWLEQHGHVPLPPYVLREDTAHDRTTYQTVYARSPGSAAAPTAGFHFTTELLDKLQAQGVARSAVTLHVGLGTFRPLKTKTLDEHQMHFETFEISEAFAEEYRRRKMSKQRLVAVGTTVVRTLESWVLECQRRGIEPGSKESAGTFSTNLFIRPGFHFQAVDDLITNFHLPRSTLLVLVAAFMGSIENMKAAYETALRSEYRFFSYGDAMMIRKAHVSN